MNNTTHTGQVKFFKNQFGFIICDNQDVNNGSDVFLHISEVEKSKIPPAALVEGKKLTFTLETGRGGKVAAGNVKLL